MKCISWNVNGLRACVQKGFLEQFNEMDADFFCIQESKLQENQIELDLESLFVDIKICVERIVIIWGRREQECVRAQLLKRTGSKRPETAQPIDSRTGLQDRISNLF